MTSTRRGARVQSGGSTRPLPSVPGSGPVCPRTWRLDLPEWGTLNRQRIAALVGGGPVDRASGASRGSRTGWGGRTHVRARVSMSTRGAVR